MPATVRLAEAAPLTGGLLLELLDVGGKPLSKSDSGKRSKIKHKGRRVIKGRRRRKG